MKKVCIFQEKIMPYRLPIFNELAKRCELTVLFTLGKCPDGADFATQQIGYRSYCKMNFLSQEFKEKISSSDVLFFPMVPCFFETWRYLCNRKFVFWSIGVPASYDCRYDSKGNFNHISFLVKHANACLFYSSYPIQKYERLGYNTSKMFVADNTVAVNPGVSFENRDSILFVGSLYPQKRIELLLEGYKEACLEHKEIVPLNIIGGGNLKDEISAFVNNNGLCSRVKLLGEIFDEGILKGYFEKALACISPDQAGLSVLKSMGYGVPYVTYRDAITGGELLNIADGKNGVLFSDFSQLKGIIIEISMNQSKYIEYGKNAYDYYHSERTPEHMVDGFMNAIDYVTKKNN